MIRFGIFDRDDNLIVHMHAENVDGALDSYAQWRSGYDTFAEMRCAGSFREAATVTAGPVSV